MAINYEKLFEVLNRNGESLNSLFSKGIITDYASRQIRNGESISLKYIEQICKYFNLPIEEIVEIKLDEN